MSNKQIIVLNEDRLKQTIIKSMKMILKEYISEPEQNSVDFGPCILKYYDACSESMCYKLYYSSKLANEEINSLKRQMAVYNNTDFKIINLSKEEFNALKVIKVLQDKKKISIDAILEKWNE